MREVAFGVWNGMRVEHTIVGISATMAQAEEAVHTLNQEGCPVKDRSIVIQALVRA